MIYICINTRLFILALRDTRSNLQISVYQTRDFRFQISLTTIYIFIWSVSIQRVFHFMWPHLWSSWSAWEATPTPTLRCNDNVIIKGSSRTVAGGISAATVHLVQLSSVSHQANSRLILQHSNCGNRRHRIEKYRRRRGNKLTIATITDNIPKCSNTLARERQG